MHFLVSHTDTYSVYGLFYILNYVNKTIIFNNINETKTSTDCRKKIKKSTINWASASKNFEKLSFSLSVKTEIVVRTVIEQLNLNLKYSS